MNQEMVKVTIDGKEHEYAIGTTYREIVDEYQEEVAEAPVILVMADGKLRELQKKLKGDCTLEFVCFIQSFFFGNTVIKFGWFLQAIVVIYLLFYISARISTKVAHTNPEAALCILMTFALSLYMGGCLIMNLSDTWYETVLAFLAGMLIAANKPVVDMILATKWRTI